MPLEPEQVDLQQLQQDVSAAKRASQAQRRNLALFTRRPQPPRGPKIQDGQLAWEAPRETRNVTQYRIYSPNDQELFSAVPVGSRRLNGLLPNSTQIYISSYNENSGLESRRVLASIGGIRDAYQPPPDPPPPPAGAPLCSNVASATAVTTYSSGKYGFTGVITLPVASPDYVKPARIAVVFKGPGSSIQEHEVTAVAPAGSPVNYDGICGEQSSGSQTGTLIFYCYNEDGIPAANPYTKAVTIAGASATGVSGREVSTSVDRVTRLVYSLIGITPVFANDIVPQVADFYLSQNNGLSWLWMNFQEVTTVGQEILVSRVKPTTNQTWKVAARVGRLGGDPNVFLSTSQLPPDTAISAGFSVTGISAPGATLGLGLTVGAGVGGTYPYDAQDPDGKRYWKIGSISYSDADLVGGDAFFVRITSQDYDAAGNPIGPEQAFAGTGINGDGGTYTYSLIGNYGSDGFFYTRRSTYPTGTPANLKFVRFRMYVGNRKNQTTGSFTDPTSMTHQTDINGGLGYIDAVVATDGSIPPGALQGNRIAPGTVPPSAAIAPGNVTLGTPTYTDIGDGFLQLRVPYTAPVGDPVFSGVVLEVEMPDASTAPPLRADGSTAWDGTLSPVGDLKPLTFGPLMYDATAPQASAVVAGPAYPMTIRMRVRSCSTDVVNPASTSPSVTLVLPPSTVTWNPASGSAYTSCATWGFAPASATAPYDINGKLDQDVTFIGIVSPTDSRFSGWEIWSSGWPDDPEFYREVPIQPPGTSRATITVPAPSSLLSITYWLVSVSIDASRKINRNPIVFGVTPQTTVPLGTGSGTIDARKLMMETLASTDFKIDEVTGLLTFKNLDLKKAANYSSEFRLNPTTNKFELLDLPLAKASGYSTEFGIDGSGKFVMLDVDMSKASKLSDQFAWDPAIGKQKIAQLDAGLLKTGALQVGGPGMVSQAKFFDTAGNLLGFDGDDTAGTGYVGSWRKRIGIGGAGPLTPNFFADSSGNVVAKSVTIADATGSWGQITSSGYAWFKYFGIGGTFGAPKILADAAGNLAINGNLIAGNITGNAGNITGTLLLTQLGTGTLPVGIVYAGRISADKIDAGTISASISMTAPDLTVTSGTVTIRLDATNYIKLTDTATQSQGYLAPSYVALKSTATNGMAALTLYNGGSGLINGALLLQTSAGSQALLTGVVGTPSNPTGPNGYLVAIIAGGVRYIPYYA